MQNIYSNLNKILKTNLILGHIRTLHIESLNTL